MNGRVLMETPVEGILVVGHGNNEGDDEFPGAGYCDLVIPILGVLVEESVILLMDANGVLDNVGLTVVIVDNPVKVLDRPQTITSQFQRVRTETKPIFPDVESLRNQNNFQSDSNRLRKNT